MKKKRKIETDKKQNKSRIRLIEKRVSRFFAQKLDATSEIEIKALTPFYICFYWNDTTFNVVDNSLLGKKMLTEKRKYKAVYPPPVLPRGPGRPEERRWPAPTPLPTVLTEDVGRVLKQILDRLDAIEKRLESIEKLLLEKRVV